MGERGREGAWRAINRSGGASGAQEDDGQGERHEAYKGLIRSAGLDERYLWHWHPRGCRRGPSRIALPPSVFRPFSTMPLPLSSCFTSMESLHFIPFHPAHLISSQFITFLFISVPFNCPFISSHPISFHPTNCTHVRERRLDVCGWVILTDPE